MWQKSQVDRLVFLIMPENWIKKPAMGYPSPVIYFELLGFNSGTKPKRIIILCAAVGKDDQDELHFLPSQAA